MTPPAPSDELAFLDATAQAALVRRGDITPLELVDAAIARIERIDPALNAVVIRDFEGARVRGRLAGPAGRTAARRPVPAQGHRR